MVVIQVLFINSALNDIADAQSIRLRLEKLISVHYLKWCCILLNDFFNTGAARREYSSEKTIDEQQLQQQLTTAMHYFEQRKDISTELLQ